MSASTTSSLLAARSDSGNRPWSSAPTSTGLPFSSTECSVSGCTSRKVAEPGTAAKSMVVRELNTVSPASQVELDLVAANLEQRSPAGGLLARQTGHG